MGRQQDLVRVVRLVYLFAVGIALIVAVGTLAPAITGAPGGCGVVFTTGARAEPDPASGGAVPQPSPVAGAPAVPSGCVQYVDVVVPAVALLIGGILLITAIRLGREPASWGRTVPIGVATGIVAGLRASYAIVGIGTSDQPPSSAGPAFFLLAAVPIVVAIGCAFAVWRAYPRSEGER